MKNVFCILCMVFVIVSSCSDEVPFSELNLYGSDMNYQIAVSGFISNEKELCRIRLMKPVSVSDSIEPITIEDASLVLKHGENTWMFQYDSLGIYSTPDSITGIAGDTYTLEISYHGETYMAEETMPYEPDDDFYLPFTYLNRGVFYVPEAQNFGYNKTNVWGIEFAYVNNETRAETELYYLICFNIFTFKGSLPQGIFQPEPSGWLFPVLTTDSMEIIKAEISDGYNKYLFDKFNETDWQGGMFSTIPGNISTNLSKGATGYFYALHVKRKRFLVSDIIVEYRDEL